LSTVKLAAEALSVPPIYAFPVVVAPPLIVSPPTCVPLPMVEDANAVKGPVMLSAVPVALVKVMLVEKRLPVVKAVEEAYGNCEAATVEEEKKTPWVQMLEVVAAVVVAKLVSVVNGYAAMLVPVR
jgi:hypothetical protein